MSRPKAIPPPTREEFQRRAALLSRKWFDALESGAKPDFDYKKAMDALAFEAKLAGINPDDALDHRSESQRITDAIEALAEMENGDSILELTTRELDAIRRQIIDTVDEMERQIDRERNREEAVLHMGKVQTLRKWISLLETAILVQEWARDKIPPRDDYGKTRDPLREYAWEAARPIRFMLYVGRSQNADAKTDNPADAIFDVEPPLVCMARTLWEAERAVSYENGRIYLDQGHWDGIMWIVQPGLGKSEFMQHVAGLAIVDNPYEQIPFIHAIEKEAQDMLEYVSNMFDSEQSVGRRVRALFPEVPRVKGKPSREKMRLDLPHRTKSPTLSAHGIKTSRSGRNASKMFFDDIVDQREVQQETVREEVFRRVNGTWLSRLRAGKGGKRGFHYTACTLWHPNDANARRLRMAAAGKTRVKVCIIPTGGPTGGPNVLGRHMHAFQPVAPRRWPERRLRAIYREWNDPALFSAAFQCNPVSEGSRIIRKLRFYDPEDTIEAGQGVPFRQRTHQRFLAAATKRLSFDPAATHSDTSDRAAMLYVGDGSIIKETPGADGFRNVSTERRIRILDAKQFRATQHELVDIGLVYSRSVDVDVVHVETRSGFHATADQFVRECPGIDLIRHDPQNKKKGIRLRASAPMLEDGNEGVRACVEFPGRWNDEKGCLEPDPKFDWLYDQILNFGMSTHGDHAVDALTQVLIFLAPEMGIATGALTQLLKKNEETAGEARDERLAAYHRRLLSGELTDRNDDEETIQCMMQPWYN